MRILQLNSVDEGGGAAQVSRNLLSGLTSRGCDAQLIVGRRTGTDPRVAQLADDDRAAFRASGYTSLQNQLKAYAGRWPGVGWGQVSRGLRLATHPRALADVWTGREDFEFPATSRVFDLSGGVPDLLHLHNLHGGYFDLRALASLSRQVPTVMTLHDGWLLSGHCAHSFDCDRWKDGCGECPDLTIEPPIRRDATAANWTRKRDIFLASSLYVASPSRWLLDRVEQSMLAPAIRESRVIPNGVDLSIFKPGAGGAGSAGSDRGAARRTLGLPADAFVILVVTGAPGNRWRDHAMLQHVIAELAARSARDARSVIVVAVGGDGLRGPGVRYDGHQTNAAMPTYYQTADVYLHCATVDTFPTTVLEALACGTPVVATDVGGIREQVVAADMTMIREADGAALATLVTLTRSGATGVLVAPGDVRAAVDALEVLYPPHQPNSSALAALGRNAHADARARFDLDRQVDRYLSWYRTIIDRWTHHAAAGRQDTIHPPARDDRHAVAQSGGVH